jgi:spore coat protein H
MFLVLCVLVMPSCDIVDEESTIAGYGIPNYELTIDSEDYATFDANEFSNLTVPGKMSVDGTQYDITIRHQGNTTRGLFKKNYFVEFNTQDPTLQCKSVVLSGQQKDKSMLRAVLSYYVFSEAGFKTSAIKPVTLCINGNSAGLYYLIEPVDEEFFVKRGSSSGELFKAVNSKADLSFTSNKEIRDGFEKKIPDDENYYTLSNLISFIDNTSGETFKREIDKYIDVNNYLKYMAVSELICNYDGIVHNYYLNREQASLKYEIIPWDLDITFNNETVICAFPGTAGLLSKLLQFQEYHDLYKQYINEYINGCFSNSKMINKIDEMKQVVAEAYANDPWLRANGGNLDAEAETLKEFVKQRNEYIKGQLINF